MNQKKWGFRIYRTTYKSDSQWSEFMTRFKAAITILKPWRESDPFPNGYDIYNDQLTASLAFDVVEDKASLDRATRPQLITLFKAWVAGEEPKTEVNEEELEKVYAQTTVENSAAGIPYQWETRAGDLQYLDSPRYRFFIQVDQECLESVLAVEDPTEYVKPPWAARYAGWVNIVNSRWPLEPPIVLEDAYRPSPHDPEIEFDNGCWFRVTPCYLYPHLLAALSSGLPHYEYLRPPRVVVDCPGGFCTEHGKMVANCTWKDHADFQDYKADRFRGIWWTNDETCGDSDEE
jgi:hypothetical protein